MGKDIGRNYKHCQYQSSTPSIKDPVLSYSAYQTSSSMKLPITSVSSAIDKNNFILLCVPKIQSKYF